jgi:hypothetical protein
MPLIPFPFPWGLVEVPTGQSLVLLLPCLELQFNCVSIDDRLLEILNCHRKDDWSEQISKHDSSDSDGAGLVLAKYQN